MDQFDRAWERIRRLPAGNSTSPELEHLLRSVYEQFTAAPVDLQRTKSALETVLVFLSSPAGRTSANCWATDLFFALGDWSGGIEWEALPEALTDIIIDMGQALHDAIDAPEIAANFGGLPEDLLKRLHNWEPK